MLVIGLTGGLASGKSTVAALFAKKGVPIIDADQIARDVTAKDSIGLGYLQQAYGDVVMQADGELDRQALRDIVLNDPEQLKTLEKITHPLIIDNLKQQIASLTADYCIVEIPLLVEKQQQDLVSRILVVDIDAERQIARAQASKNMTLQQIKQLIKKQATAEQRLAMADDVIINNGDFTFLKAQVDTLHVSYLAMAKSQL